MVSLVASESVGPPAVVGSVDAAPWSHSGMMARLSWLSFPAGKVGVERGCRGVVAPPVRVSLESP